MVGLVILVAAALTRGRSLENNDVSWFAMSAGRMLQGGGYARDFFEINMPFAIAAYIPPNLVATMLHLPLRAVIDGMVLLLIAHSVVLCLLLFRDDGNWIDSPGARLLMPAWLLLLLCFGPGYDFAQREHLITILVLPFLFLVGLGDARVGPKLRICISTQAALGALIKPHYALLPWLLLAMQSLRSRSWRPLLGTEARMLATLAAAVGITSFYLFPDWVTCAHWAADLYSSFKVDVFSRTVALRGIGVVAACLIFQAALLVLEPEFKACGWPFPLASAYSLGLALLQGKGWQYHFLPSIIFAFVGQGIALTLLIRPSGRLGGTARVVQGVIAGALVVAAAFTTASAARSPLTRESLGPIPTALSAVARMGDPVYAFSIEVTPMLPTIPMLGMKWASRYSSLWPLPALLQASTRGDAESRQLLARYRQPFIDSIREDFERYHPRVVLVDRRPLPYVDEGYDVMSFFLTDPRFASIWAGYVQAGTVTYPGESRGLDIYVRVDHNPPALNQSSDS